MKKKTKKLIDLAPINFYKVWDKSIPYWTSDELDPEIAKTLGFEVWTPKKSDISPQVFIEAPSKKSKSIFIEALRGKGIEPTLHKYDDDISQGLGWDVWDGFKRGYKDADDAQLIVKNLLETEEVFESLKSRTFKCLFKKGRSTPDANGNYVVAFIQVGNTLLRRGLTSYDFVITLYHEFWSWISDESKVRLIMHEMLHANVSGNPTTVGHDIEEFKYMYERWNVPVGEDMYCGKDETIRIMLESEAEEKEEAKNNKDSDY